MVDTSIVGVIQRLGIGDILLWLLSFAIVYGILSMVNIPKQKSIQGIIAIVLAFMVLLAVPAALITTLSTLSTGLVVVMLGILVFLVLVEAAGMKHYEKRKITGKTEAGEPYELPALEEIPLFTKHKEILAAALVIIAVLIFVGAGGLNLIGFKLNIDITGVAFLIMIILAVLWMIKGGKGEK